MAIKRCYMADKKTLELQIRLFAQQASEQLRGFAAQIRQFAREADISTDELEELGGEMNEFARNASSSFQNAGSSLSDLKSNLMSLGEVAAAGAIDRALVGMAKSALDASDSFQEAKDDFGIMLGDMKLGQGLFNELQKFNKWTPFEMTDTAQATKVLLSAKVELKDITEYLTRFGDISQGNSQRFQSFIGAFSKASAKGKADMEVLNVYIDQGVQVLDALGKELGVTSGEVVKMASEGKISFETFDEALRALAAEGGLYYNSMITASQRLGATQDSLQDSVKALKASLGDLLAPAVKKVLDFFDNLVNAINDSPILKGLLVGAIAALAAVINGKMIVALIGMISKIWSAYAAQMALNTAMSVTQPWLIAAVAAVGAATAGFVAYASAQQDAADASANLALEQEKLKIAADDMVFNQIPAIYQQKLDEKAEKEKEFAATLSNANAILEHRNQLYAKTPAAQKEALEAELEFAKSLRTLKTVNEDGSVSGFDQTKTEAIISDLEKRLEKFKEKVEEVGTLGSEWQEKILTGVSKINKEFENSKNSLAEKAKNLLGDEYETNAEYIKELASLEEYYNGKIADQKRKELNEWANSYKAYLDEINYKKLEGIKEKDWGKAIGSAAAGSALQGLEGTEAGQVVQGAAMGGPIGALVGVVSSFVTALAKAIGELESGGKILNFASTIVGEMFEIIGPLIDAALKPTAHLLEVIGKVLGKIVRPFAAIAALVAQTEPIMQVVTVVLEALGEIFEGIYILLKPLFEALANGYNFIVDLLRVIGIKLQKVSINFGESEKISEETIQAQREMIQNQYSRLQSNIQDLLNSQIDSLRAQYSLGLITRADYEKQAEKYAVTADNELLEVNKMQAEALAQIEKNTYASATGNKEGLDEARKSYAKKFSDEWGENAGWIGSLAGGIVGGIADVGVAIWDGMKAVGNWFAGLFGFADGSPNIETDQIAKIHKGETIIPRTFAQGIREGELALVGRNNGGNSTAPIYVTVNVGGSVLAERELVDCVYTGIARAIQTGSKSPLPAA